MVRLILSAPLAALLPAQEPEVGAPVRSVAISASRWEDVVRELRQRFPRLAERVLDATGAVATGFVLVLADEVVADAATIELRAGDEIFLIPALAGG